MIGDSPSQSLLKLRGSRAVPREGLYERVGEERFRKLMETLTVPQISTLLCTHHEKDELRARCNACRRAIYRSISQIKEKDRRDQSLSPIDNFELIPEIQRFKDYLGDVAVATRHKWLTYIKRSWELIRESKRPKLIQNQRPLLWDTETIDYILSEVTNLNVASYQWKQALRRLFESMGRFELLKYKKLKARRRDQISPKGSRRVKTYATPKEFLTMLDNCDTEYERLKLKVHVTIKSREGSLPRHRELGASFCNLRWERVLWNDEYYNPPKATIGVFETKTGGGTLWTHCPLDLYWHDLPQQFRAYWESLGCPTEGYVWGEESYEEYKALFHKIMERTGLDLTPHDMRDTGASWLHSLGADNLAIGQYTPGQNAIGFGGVGWENAEIYFQRYGRLTPEAVFKLHAFVHKEIGFNGA